MYIYIYSYIYIYKYIYVYKCIGIILINMAEVVTVRNTSDLYVCMYVFFLLYLLSMLHHPGVTLHTVI